MRTEGSKKEQYSPVILYLIFHHLHCYGSVISKGTAGIEMEATALIRLLFYAGAQSVEPFFPFIVACTIIVVNVLVVITFYHLKFSDR